MDFASTIQARGKGYHALIEKAAIVMAALGALIAERWCVRDVRPL
ncbi:MAG: hypothetical protein V9G98_19520 [Candidatus Competibacter sp.]